MLGEVLVQGLNSKCISQDQEMDLSTGKAPVLLDDCSIKLEEMLEACNGGVDGSDDGIHLLVNLDVQVDDVLLVLAPFVALLVSFGGGGGSGSLSFAWHCGFKGWRYWMRPHCFIGGSSLLFPKIDFARNRFQRK